MLFDVPLIEGLALSEAFVTVAEEQALIAAIDQVGLSPFRF